MNSLNKKFELLDPEKILTVIEPQNRCNLAQLEIFDVIDSTNTYLLSRAKTSSLSGSVCFAEEQTSGRGRLDRRWYSPRYANIYCSLLWQFESLDNISTLSIAVAVIVMSALKKYGLPSVQLKWPNDILFCGRKLAGILLESKGKNIVIGIGINLYLPEDADPNWISVQDILQERISRNYLAGLLLNELLKELPIFQAKGLKAFLDKWHEADVLINKPITLYTPNQIFTGVMKGINNEGQLLLQNETEEILSFSYGEVSTRSSL